jgi:hypothetical protein
MAWTTFRNAALVVDLAAGIGLCPPIASGTPLARVDPSRTTTTVFGQAVRDQSSAETQGQDDEGALSVEEAPHAQARPQQTLPLSDAGDRKPIKSPASAFGLY